MIAPTWHPDGTYRRHPKGRPLAWAHEAHPGGWWVWRVGTVGGGEDTQGKAQARAVAAWERAQERDAARDLDAAGVAGGAE